MGKISLNFDELQSL